jgi:2-polyprenyl-3-methyl-5-hydroxy-6-metoxy-1,4-benzoquinol methylase
MMPVPNCRFCGAPLTATLVDLGEMPLANSYVTEAAAAKERRFPLQVRVCPQCLLVQADHTIPADAIFVHDYAYFSSYSDSWVDHAKRYASAMIERFKLGPDALVIEVASNDGYLLQHFLKRGVPVLGIEPAARVADAALKKGIPTEIVFFNSATAKRLAASGVRADLMAANNVLAHVPDIRDFVAGFAALLKPEGVATFEFPHVLNLIREVQFDTIYHEHYSYLSLASVERILATAGLRAIDVEEIETHGGSLRLYAAHVGSSHVAAPALRVLRAKEKSASLDRLEGYQGYADRVHAVKAGFLAFLRKAKAAGKTVAAYGAAAKGNTFLNFCGVTANDIVCVFDRSAAKQGKLLPGSHIPIFSPARLSEIKPDYLVILPWNITEEIIAANADIKSWGGQFVVAVPALRVFS